MTSHDLLRLVSYNCRGWNSGQHTVFDLLQSCDICFVQEHWLLHEQLNLLNIHCDFQLVRVEWIVLNFNLVDLLVAAPSCTEDPFFLTSRALTLLPSVSVLFCCVIGVVCLLSVFVFISLTMMDLLLHIMIS